MDLENKLSITNTGTTLYNFDKDMFDTKFDYKHDDYKYDSAVKPTIKTEPKQTKASTDNSQAKKKIKVDINLNNLSAKAEIEDEFQPKKKESASPASTYKSKFNNLNKKSANKKKCNSQTPQRPLTGDANRF